MHTAWWIRSIIFLCVYRVEVAWEVMMDTKYNFSVCLQSRSCLGGRDCGQYGNLQSILHHTSIEEPSLSTSEYSGLEQGARDSATPPPQYWWILNARMFLEMNHFQIWGHVIFSWGGSTLPGIFRQILHFQVKEFTSAWTVIFKQDNVLVRAKSVCVQTWWFNSFSQK